METEYEQKLINEGVSQDFINSEREKGKSGLLKGSNVDKQDYNPILSAWQSSGFNPNITPQDVYSQENIQNASDGNYANIDYSDPYGVRDYFLNSPDLVTKRTDVEEATAALAAARQSARDRQIAIEETPFSMNVMRGFQGIANDKATADLAAKAETLSAAQAVYDTYSKEANAKYDIAERERSSLQDLILKTGGNAGITYTDSWDTAVKKASAYEEKKAKEAEEKAKKEADQKEKDALKSDIKAMGGNIKTKKGGSMNTKQLREEYARLKGEEYKSDQDWTLASREMQINQYNKSMSGGGSSDISETDLARGIESRISQAVSNKEYSQDGYMNPEDYLKLRKEWTQSGFNGKSFDDMFGYYINPQEGKEGQKLLKNTSIKF